MSKITEVLDQIEARVNAATDGPWRYLSRGYIETPPIEVDEANWGPDGHHGLSIHTGTDEGAYRYTDVEFIAHARTDVPRLVAALRAVLSLANDTDSERHECDEDDVSCSACWGAALRAAISTALADDGR